MHTLLIPATIPSIIYTYTLKMNSAWYAVHYVYVSFDVGLYKNCMEFPHMYINKQIRSHIETIEVSHLVQTIYRFIKQQMRAHSTC